MAKFVAHVNLQDTGGRLHSFSPGDEIPAWAQDKIGDDQRDKPLTAAQLKAIEKKEKAAADAEAKAVAKAKAEAEAKAKAEEEAKAKAKAEEEAKAESGADQKAGAPDFTSEND